jgi:adenylate cyclase class IV
MKYEVEYKVELSEAEAENLRTLFKEKGFTAGGVDQQDDYYVEAKESQVYKGKGVGYDLKRYRNESGTVFYTEKTWEMAGDVPARKELEHEVTFAEFETEIAKYPNALKIKKQREWFEGSSADLPEISVTIDSTKFDHSPSVRYFIEAETNTDDINEVPARKEKIIVFLKDILGKDEIVESPGMFSMAFKKK